MRKIVLAAAAALAFQSAVPSAFAAEEIKPMQHHWTFDGILGKFDKAETLGNHSSLTLRVLASICDLKLDRDERTWHFGLVRLIDKDCALLENVSVSLDDDADHGIKQRMTWTQECSDGFALDVDQSTLERHPLVLRLDCIASPDFPVSSTYGHGDVGNLVATILALLHASTQNLESPNEKRLEYDPGSENAVGPDPSFPE